MAGTKTATAVGLTFVRDKETKNTVRFQEDGDENMVGTLYVAKRLAKEAQHIRVEITVLD